MFRFDSLSMWSLAVLWTLTWQRAWAARTSAYIISKSASNERVLDCSRAWDVGRGFLVVDSLELGDKPLAFAELIDRRAASGWDELVLIANSTKLTLKERRFAVGALEAFLTADRIVQLIGNVKTLRDNNLLVTVLEYLVEWHNQVSVKVATGTANDPYWARVGHVLERLNGLEAGLNSACSGRNVPLEDLLLLQSDADVVDIEKMLGYTPSSLKAALLVALGLREKRVSQLDQGSKIAEGNDQSFWHQLLTQSKCSALIRRRGNGEIIVGHATWAKYAEMIRVFRHVDFGDTSARTSYSGFAGMIASTDDFYVTSNGLAVLETSLNIIDTKSLDYMVENHFKGVPSWVRTVLAMENAANADEWIASYSREMSFTGNCQWMILDRKRMSKSTGLLTVFESLPGYFDSRDMTSTLISNGFLSSQNTPALNKVRIEGRYPDTAAQLAQGSCTACTCHFSYDNNPRGCIFKRDAPFVETEQDMAALMRSNNYLTDPLSLGDPENAIAARSDLRSTDKDASGAIDAKVLSLGSDEMFASPHIIGGIVVNEQCPTFTDFALFSSASVQYNDVSGLTGAPKEWFRVRRFVV